MLLYISSGVRVCSTVTVDNVLLRYASILLPLTLKNHNNLLPWDEVVANIITIAVDHPDTVRGTNERPVYHAACKDEYLP